MRPLLETIPFSAWMLNWWQIIPQKLRAHLSHLSALMEPPDNPAQDSTKSGAFPFNSLEAYLHTQPRLPESSMIAGIGKDGLPYIINFRYPVPGSILILGDANSGKSQLLKAMFASAVALNPPEQLRLTLFVEKPQEYMSLFHSPHCASLCSTNGQRMEKIVKQLYEEGMARRKRRGQNAVWLLGLDDLAASLAHLEIEAQRHLYWLIKHGAKYHIWTVATLSTSRLKEVRLEFINAFRTRLYRNISARDIAKQINAPPPALMQKLRQGMQFALPYGEGWEVLTPLIPELSSKPEAKEIEQGGK